MAPRTLLLFAALSLGCPPSAEPPQPVPVPTPTTEPDEVGGDTGSRGPFAPASDEELASLVKSGNAFAGDLYAQLAKSEQGNFAASPTSIALALSMTYGGARGETAQEMHDTLRFSSDADTTHRAFGTLLRSWIPKADAQYELTVANRLFGAKAVQFQAAFLGLTKDHYQAPLEALDFRGQAEASRKHINGWVEEQTKKKIADLLPEGSIKADTQLVLANAIYFNGTWVEKFEEQDTKSESFFGPGGEVKTPMMHMQTRFQLAESDDVLALSMFYRGGPTGMTVLLSKKKDGLPTAEKIFTEGKLDALLGTSTLKTVNVALPKFKISGGSMSLKSALSAMGMPAAFDEMRADFGGMAPVSGPKLFIGEVFHKAFVDVHERGTEAAAATGVIMYPTSIALPQEPKQFIADHPFLFFIRDTDKGTILFMGRVTNPTQ